MKKKKITRRDFIKNTSLVVAGGLLGLSPTSTSAQMRNGMGGGGGGGGGGGSMFIDPPVGTSFKDPVEMSNLSSQPGIVEVDLSAQIAAVNVNGSMANLMTFNGVFPGPTLRAKRGDIVRINYTNNLPNTGQTNLLGYQRNVTNLHTHGWHVSPRGAVGLCHVRFMAGGYVQT